MGYVENNLSADEKIVVKAKVHWGIFLPGMLVLAIAVFASLNFPKAAEVLKLCLYVAAAIILASEWLVFITTELAVTSRRVIAKIGIVKRETIELNLTKVESFSVQQGIVGRLLNFGTIIIRGTGGTPTPISAISHPLEFRRIATQTVDGAQTPAAAAQ